MLSDLRLAAAGEPGCSAGWAAGAVPARLFGLPTPVIQEPLARELPAGKLVQALLDEMAA